jgi:hypothetical protein
MERGALDLMISTPTKQALKRLALHGNEPMTAVMERLVLAEDERIGRSLSDDEFREYGDRAVTRKRIPTRAG